MLLRFDCKICKLVAFSGNLGRKSNLGYFWTSFQRHLAKNFHIGLATLLDCTICDSPLTLDTIQLGMHRLAMANTSAAKNRAPDIMLSLSIARDDEMFSFTYLLHSKCLLLLHFTPICLCRTIDTLT